MFEWNDAFSVGIRQIDEQHKHLFEIGEQIHELSKDFSDQDRFDEITQAITDLVNYTVFHFGTEEMLFEKHGYQEAEEHRKEHQKFVDYLNGLDLSHIDAHQENTVKELLKFVALWIFKHINNTDFRYRDHLIKSMAPSTESKS